jgi:uncharacterized membrane protein
MLEDTTPNWFLLLCFAAIILVFLTLEIIKAYKSPNSNHYDFLAPKKKRKVRK